MPEWSESILHVDMDAFYVECERLRRPELDGVPVAVGGRSQRSVIASASYEARGFGVASAMPTVAAMRRCAELVVIPPDHSEYARISEMVFAEFRRFTPLVEGLGLDEAFLDVAGLRRHYSDATAVARAVRERVRGQIGLPCSVGIAANKFVAKLASAHAKPDGLLHVGADDQVGFIRSLPLRALWGVGPATHAALARMGISTIEELAQTDVASLGRGLGDGLARHLMNLANGIDGRKVETVSESKSVSAEETFDTDLEPGAVLDQVLRRQADRVASRLRRSGLKARTVTVKVRFSDFSTVTRSETLSVSTSNDIEMFRVAQRLLARATTKGVLVRLLGLAATGFDQEDGSQLELPVERDRGELDQTIDAIRSRFGSATIGPASSVES